MKFRSGPIRGSGFEIFEWSENKTFLLRILHSVKHFLILVHLTFGHYFEYCGDDSSLIVETRAQKVFWRKTRPSRIKFSQNNGFRPFNRVSFIRPGAGVGVGTPYKSYT